MSKIIDHYKDNAYENLETLQEHIGSVMQQRGQHPTNQQTTADVDNSSAASVVVDDIDDAPSDEGPSSSSTATGANQAGNPRITEMFDFVFTKLANLQEKLVNNTKVRDRRVADALFQWGNNNPYATTPGSLHILPPNVTNMMKENNEHINTQLNSLPQELVNLLETNRDSIKRKFKDAFEEALHELPGHELPRRRRRS